MVSLSVERGLAYCPANRPTRTTGLRSPCTRTRLICSSTLRRVAENSAEQAAHALPATPLPARPDLDSKATAAPCGCAMRKRTRRLANGRRTGYGRRKSWVLDQRKWKLGALAPAQCSVAHQHAQADEPQQAPCRHRQPDETPVHIRALAGPGHHLANHAGDRHRLHQDTDSRAQQRTLLRG